MENYLPPLIDLIDKEPKPGITFEELIKKLFINDSQINGYTFDVNPEYRHLEVDALVERGYPGVEGVAIFKIISLKASVRNGSVFHQVERLFRKVVQSKAVFSAYILVTPEDLTDEKEQWLIQFRKMYNLDLRHYGQTKILELLSQYPALEKYFYGEYFEEVPQSFNSLKQKYKDAIANEVKELEFIGLPTAQYKERDLLKEVELSKIYIPLNFCMDENGSRTMDLPEVKEQFKRFVILGDPGTGKSILAKYMVLEHCKKGNEDDFSRIEDRIPFFIPLSDFEWVNQKKSRPFDFIDYLKYTADNKYNFGNIDRDFFVAVLELGKAVVIFDGLDEIKSENFRSEIVRAIEKFSESYLDSSVCVTSRVFGYKNTGGLNSKFFKHFYLTQVSPDQADKFIQMWYEIQIGETLHIKNIIKPLNMAFESLPYMQWFKKNPLFLTMLLILNQHGIHLPDNRNTLYKNCFELLLKTWPNRKYRAFGGKNPIEKRGINYEKQLELLSAAAVYIQDKYQDKIGEEEGVLIPESELIEVLFKAYFDKDRMVEEIAREDVKLFFHYIVDRAGLFVEIRKEKIGERDERLFSFIHRSFREYLYAHYRVTNEKIQDKEHITFIINHMGEPPWQEIILFYFLLLREHKDQKSIELISKNILKALSTIRNPEAWLLMGRALRDNMEFDREGIVRITTEILEQWIRNPDKNVVFPTLKEIMSFSRKGKIVLKEVLKESIIQRTAKDAFKSLYLIKQLYTFDDTIIDCVSNKNYKENFLPYLPIYRDDKLLSKYINENLKEIHWVIYYNSTKERPLENFNRIILYQLSDHELKGCILSSFGKIFETFQQRSLFLKRKKQILNGEIRSDGIELDFSYVNFGSVSDTISHPLLLFKHFLINPPEITALKIHDRFFALQDRIFHIEENHDPIKKWVKNLLLKVFSAFNLNLPGANQFNPRELEHIEKASKDFAEEFCREVNQYFNQSFNEDLHKYISSHPYKKSKYLSIDFIHYISRYFRKEFGKDPSRGTFNQRLRRKISRDLGKAFSRYFRRDLTRDLSEVLVHSLLEYLNQDFKHYSRDFRQYLQDNQRQEFTDLILSLYFLQHGKKLKWKNVKVDNYRMIYNLFVNEFNKQENLEFIDQFHIYLYEYLFNNKFETSFESHISSGRSLSVDDIITFPKIHLSIRNPFMIPFTFNFILSGALNHYIIKLLADLNNRFYKKQEPSKDVLLEAVDDYIYNHPFVSYFINYSWDYFCKEFKAQYQEENESNSLRLASFIIHAAKVSMVTDMSCTGDEWDEILKEAEESEDSFVQISLTLYKLCNFIETTKESERLEKLLGKFKKDYPDYYKLIGFRS